MHSHIISPLPSSDSSSDSDDSDDFGTNSEPKNNDNSEQDSVMAESELGEFLMDTFEGLDAMEVNALLTASV